MVACLLFYRTYERPHRTGSCQMPLDHWNNVNGVCNLGNTGIVYLEY